MLSREEIARYRRHLSLPGIGLHGQEKLKRSRVLVVGAGGLGCAALQYLAAAGAGTIGIVDFDVVEASNLQRQVLYAVSDLGSKKAIAAAARLAEQNPLVMIRTFDVRLTAENVNEIFSDFDMVIDGTDDLTTRCVIDAASAALGIPMIYGAVDRFEGQVGIFNMKRSDGTCSPGYRSVFQPSKDDPERSCGVNGVLGVLPGIIGAFQASEAIKIITGIGEPLCGKLLVMNLLTTAFTIIDTEPALTTAQHQVSAASGL